MTKKSFRNVICFSLFIACYAVYYCKCDWTNQKFWYEKKFGYHDTNLVFLGDSRTLQGVDPVSVCESMGGNFTGYNQSFNSGSLNDEMIDLAESHHLTNDKDSLHVIVLGVTPRSLSVFLNEHYETIGSRDNFIPSPIPPSKMVSMIKFQLFSLLGYPIPERNGINVVNSGWRKVVCKKKPNQKKVESSCCHYRDNVFARGKKGVRPEIIDKLLGQVSRLQKKGVHVFAYRPPTCPEMEAVEDEFAGFDEHDFGKRFEEAGGVWLDLRVDDYYCYDGSHLEAESAKKFSRRLGTVISKYLNSSSVEVKKEVSVSYGLAGKK